MTMPVPIDWHALAEQVDDTCDRYFGVTVTHVPWVRDQDQPDYQRSGSDFVGIFVSPGTTVESDFGNANLANADLRLSVRRIYLGGVQQYDRIKVNDPKIGGLYEIAYFDPGDTDRSILYLLRLKGVTP